MARGTAQTKGLTTAQHSFAQVPSANIPRSKFNRSCGLKTAMDSGLLVPIFADETLPGDTLNMRATVFGRMATPIYPVMDNIWLDTFWFAIPLRQIWNNWQIFNGEKPDPSYSTVHMPPTITENVAVGTLSDYLGIPTGIAGLEFNSFWHRAYNWVFNEWFRSQDLTDPAVVDLDDGPDTSTDYVLRRRTKRHDYFTSCLPFAQKGDPVELSFGGLAPVEGTGIPTFDVGVATTSKLISHSTQTLRS